MRRLCWTDKTFVFVGTTHTAWVQESTKQAVYDAIQTEIDDMKPDVTDANNFTSFL